MPTKPKPQKPLDFDTLKRSDYMDDQTGKVKRRYTTEADREWYMIWKKKIEKREGIIL